MKAYIAKLENEEWQMLVHGETSGKAKNEFCRDNPAGYYADEIWNDIRLSRIPEWDDKPFIDCHESRSLFAPLEYNDDGTGIYEIFYNDCTCKLCRPELHKE